MTAAEFTMGVAAAAAITENGHTNLRMTGTVGGLNSLPVRFFWFGDGLHILRARASHAHLIGARVAAYDGTAPEVMITSLDPYFGGNEHFLRFNSPIFFASPAAMHAANLAKSPDGVVLDLILPDGTLSEVMLAPETSPTPVMWVDEHPLAVLSRQETESEHDWRHIDPDISSAAFYGGNPNAQLWSEDLPDNGHYIRFRLIADDGDRQLKPWLATLHDRFSEAPLDYLVLDVRSTFGGDYTKAKNFAGKVADILTPDGRVYILTDEGTFSAAIVTVAFAVENAGTQAVIVGAPMGDDEQFWAESGGIFTLPNSGLRISVATGYHDWENGCDSWANCFWLNILFGVAAGPLDPDIFASLTYKDYSTGVDTTMQAVFDAQGVNAHP